MTESIAVPITENVGRLEGILRDALVDDPTTGKFRVNRRIFTDEDLYEIEMKYIFEGNWIFLAHESQIPNIGDYYTTYMGRQPVVLTRSSDGELNCLINACSHRGAMICRRKTDNRKTFTCPFHGWTFRNDGKLLKVKVPEGAGYPEEFNSNGSHNMTKVARFDSYRGFLFGSLNPDVLSLSDYLGDMTKLLDMFVDQAGPEGMEVLRGGSSYTYDGNWKLQMENGADGYHVTTVHWNYQATTARRRSGESSTDLKTLDATTWSGDAGSYWSFKNGHLCLWSKMVNAPDIARWASTDHDALAQKLGQEAADFTLGYTRNNGFYPNLFLMDQLSSQIRVIRPISVDKTLVTIYCIAPKGEDAKTRALRIRQFEDFFNASGMATADDLEEFRGFQRSARATAAPWNDISRGAQHWLDGADPLAKKLGINPLSSGIKVEDEGLFVTQHSHWLDSIRAGVANERSIMNSEGN